MWPQQKGYHNGCTGGRWLRLYRDTVQWQHHMSAIPSQVRNTRRGNKCPRLRDDNGSPAGAEDADVNFRWCLGKTRLFGLLLIMGVWSKNYTANVSCQKCFVLFFFIYIYNKIIRNVHNCLNSQHIDVKTVCTLQRHSPEVLLQSLWKPLLVSQLHGPHMGLPHHPWGQGFSTLLLSK